MNNALEMFTLAIGNEVLSQKLYRALAAGFGSKPEIALTLTRLADMEKAHEDKLRNSFSGQFSGKSPDVRAELKSVAVPEDFATPDRILQFAINREKIAADIYHKMALEADDMETVTLLEGLAKEEENHLEILETEILRMDGLVIWFDQSELSGLMED